MRPRLLLLLAAGLLIAADAPSEEAKKDQDKMKGTWKVASGERAGMALADGDALKTLVLTINGDKYTAKVGDENEAGSSSSIRPRSRSKLISRSRREQTKARSNLACTRSKGTC